MRISDIVGVIIKYRLDEYIFRRAKPLLLASQLIRTTFRHGPIDGTIGYRIRKALEELGPVYVKFGQMLSTRPDIIPSSVIKELELLRESVEPFNSHIAVRIIENDLRQPLYGIFSSFDMTPAAAGSVAQVHYGVLITGEAVAVKILRPNIQTKIKKDIQLLKQVARLVEIYKPDVKKIQIAKIIDELSKSISIELDLRNEALSLRRFAANMQEFTYIHVPKVYTRFSGANTLTMERMQGIPINHVDVLREQGVDIEILVSQGIESLIIQIFRDGFFHADQHPGNLWIKPDGTRIYLDFGIMGELSSQDRKTLLAIILALYSYDSSKIISLIIAAGWVESTANSMQLHHAVKMASTSIVNRQQSEFSLGKVVNELFQSLQKSNVNIPYQFTQLAKTILVVEGISKQIAPNLNLQAIAGPILLKHFTASKTLL